MSAADHLNPDQFIYRGLPLRGHDPSPEGIRARLKDRMLGSPDYTGTHWTASYDTAHGFASGRARYEPWDNVVLHATDPGHRMSKRQQHATGVIPGPEEQEVSLRHHDSVRVHRISVSSTIGPYRTPDRHYDVDWDLRA